MVHWHCLILLGSSRLASLGRQARVLLRRNLLGLLILLILLRLLGLLSLLCLRRVLALHGRACRRAAGFLVEAIERLLLGGCVAR